MSPLEALMLTRFLDFTTSVVIDRSGTSWYTTLCAGTYGLAFMLWMYGVAKICGNPLLEGGGKVIPVACSWPFQVASSNSRTNVIW